MQDKNGNIWFSNWGGAYRYDARLNDEVGQGKSFTSFTKKDGLSGDMVARIIEDKKGNLWFGGDGLSRYDARLPAVPGRTGMTKSGRENLSLVLQQKMD